MKKAIAMLALMMFAASFMTACNTIEGAGRDIERGGEKLQGAAKNAQQNM